MTHPFDNNEATFAGPANEDAFFVLRDIRQLLERRIVEIARQAAIGGQPLVDAFATAVGEAHDELANDKQRDGFESADGLTASRLTLMGDADLELDIRIGEISRKLAERCGNPLWRAQQRYITLLKRPEMRPEDNPIGAEALAAGFWAVCNVSDSPLDQKLELLARLEEQLAAELPAVCEEINDLLTERKIEPAQSQIVQPPSARRDGSTTTDSSAVASGGADPLATLQKALGQQFGGMPGSGGAGVTINAATLVMLNQLAARLEQLELAAETQAGNDAEAGPAALPRAIKAADLNLPLGNPEGIALETLGYIFEAIFGIWDLPDTVKTAIGRLQIPLLRLSITDPSLFSDPNHPARRLINAMGRVASGLPRDIPRAHPISSRLWKISATVSEKLHGGGDVLGEACAELNTLIIQRDASIRAAAEPLVAHLKTQEANVARTDLVRRWLEETASVSSAREIHEFLRNFWVRVMTQAINAGVESSEWINGSTAASELLWSVQPKVDADERKRLAALVPGLIRKINSGLDRIGVTQEERAPFLDACFNLQTASLRGAPAPQIVMPLAGSAQMRATRMPDSEAVGDVDLHWWQTDGTVLYRPAAAQSLDGQWLQFSSNDGETLTGLVCWVSPKQGTLLLCNPDWKFALAVGGAIIDQKHREGGLINLSARAIFDEASQEAVRAITKGIPAN